MQKKKKSHFSFTLFSTDVFRPIESSTRPCKTACSRWGSGPNQGRVNDNRPGHQKTKEVVSCVRYHFACITTPPMCSDDDRRTLIMDYTVAFNCVASALILACSNITVTVSSNEFLISTTTTPAV